MSDDEFAQPATPESRPGWSQAFTVDDLAEIRRALRHQARHAGFRGEALDDLLVAAHELVTNAIRHGGGRGTIEVRHDADMLICEVTDDGPGFASPPMQAQPPPTDMSGGRGLWLAQRLTDRLTLQERPGGVTAAVALRLPQAGGPSTSEEPTEMIGG